MRLGPVLAEQLVGLALAPGSVERLALVPELTQLVVQLARLVELVPVALVQLVAQQELLVRQVRLGFLLVAQRHFEYSDSWLSV